MIRRTEGAAHFIKTIEEIHRISPGARIEMLIPDLQGNYEALGKISIAGPDALNHNLETVPRLYSRVRPEAIYARSLELNSQSKVIGPNIPTKSGFMLGLGETRDELLATMQDLLKNTCESLHLANICSHR